MPDRYRSGTDIAGARRFGISSNAIFYAAVMQATFY
jgi:hypothetical protein